LPTELIAARPTAAAVPPRNAVGSDQNSGAQVSTPAAATDRATRDSAVDPAQPAASEKPTAPMRLGTTRCQRRSRRLSAERPSTFIVTSAARNGTALSAPIARLPSMPVDSMNVGIQKVRAY
jgi:hypothetical protein